MALILFDLDGTLLDTAPDLGAALNAQRSEHRLAPLPLERIRPLVSHGSPALLKLGFGVEPNDSRYASMRARLLDIYRGCLSDETRFFPGWNQCYRSWNAAGYAGGSSPTNRVRSPNPW